MYSVVLFAGENAVKCVPSSWVQKFGDEKYCKWPPKLSRDKVTKIIEKCGAPSSNWHLIRCSVKHVAPTYEECRLKIAEASYTSTTDVSSDDETDLKGDRSSNANREDKKQVCPSSKKVVKKQAVPLPSVATTSGIQSNEQKEIFIESNSNKKRANEIESKKQSRALTMIQTEIEKVHKELEKMKNEIEEQFDDHLEAYESLYEELFDIKEEIKQLKKIKKPALKPISEPKIFRQLPLKTVKDLEGFEKILDDDVHQQNFISMLCKFGSATIASTVHQIIKKVLTNKVAAQFSLHGTDTTKAFIDSNLCFCIRAAVLRSPAGKGVHGYEVNKCIGARLAYAKQLIKEPILID